MICKPVNEEGLLYQLTSLSALASIRLLNVSVEVMFCCQDEEAHPHLICKERFQTAEGYNENIQSACGWIPEDDRKKRNLMSIISVTGASLMRPHKPNAQ
jgi:hypothetical protein